MTGPILCAQSPRRLVVRLRRPLRRSPIFGIETNEIDAHIGVEFAILLNGSGQLKHHGYATGCIVSGQNRLTPLRAVGVVIGPRTAVPMGAKQQSCFGFRMNAGNDVRAVQRRSVITFEHGFLCFHRAAIAFELRYNPLFATVVAFAVHIAWAKSALCRRKRIGTVGIKRGSYGRKFLHFGRLFHISRCRLMRFIPVQTTQNHCGGHHSHCYFHCFFHTCTVTTALLPPSAPRVR